MHRGPISRFLALSLIATAVGSYASPAPVAAEEPVIVFEGGGFGHGVGMSQFGALGRADDGQSAEEILGFYYEGTSLAVWTPEEIDAVLGDDEFAVTAAPAERDGYRFDRLACEAGFEIFCPGDVETAVGGFERLDGDAARLQDGHPGAG